MATLKHPPARCPCGRLVTAGRTTGAHGHDRCLICETSAVMATFVYPPPPPPFPDGELFPPPPVNQKARPS